MTQHVTTIQVRYAETDQMGVVYYANYLVWMEVARTDMCRALGFAYRDMEVEDGILLAVAESRCRYLSPAKYDETIEIRTEIAESNRRMITFHYTLNCGDRRVATGETKHIYLGRDLRPVRLPDKYAAFLGTIPPDRVP